MINCLVKFVQGWANKEEGDAYFKRQRERADQASDRSAYRFFKMMQEIGDELQAATGVLTLHKKSPEVLDLCMAPGGYSASALKYSPHAHVSGVTLPKKEGGHPLLIRRGYADKRVQAIELDITMLWSEFCTEDIPEDHPDHSKFLPGQRPYLGKSFDLVFCDGQVLRTHARATYRESKEALRLICSQLILALQRIRPGGTMIILLHKLDAWDSLKLLFQFSKFADIQLFKPKRKHAQRSSFYLIATNVNPIHPTAISAVTGWKSDWREATFAYQETATPGGRPVPNSSEISQVLAEFGSTVIDLGEPIWATQRDALEKADFIPKETANSQLPISPEALHS